MLITGRLSPSISSELVTVINTVINRPVKNTSIVHGTLVPMERLAKTIRFASPKNTIRTRPTSHSSHSQIPATTPFFTPSGAVSVRTKLRLWTVWTTGFGLVLHQKTLPGTSNYKSAALSNTSKTFSSLEKSLSPSSRGFHSPSRLPSPRY